jgi:hypothetical protein
MLSVLSKVNVAVKLVGKSVKGLFTVVQRGTKYLAKSADVLWHIKNGSIGWLEKYLIGNPLLGRVKQLISVGCKVADVSLLDKIFGTIKANAAKVCGITVNSWGMVKPGYHYNKHGLKELIDKGLPPVSPQRYFDDALNFVDNNFNNPLFKKTPIIITSTGQNGFKIRNPITGEGGIFGPNKELITYWYAS